MASQGKGELLTAASTIKIKNP